MRLVALGEHPGFWEECVSELSAPEREQLIVFLRWLADAEPSLEELSRRLSVRSEPDTLTLTLSARAWAEFDVLREPDGYALVGRAARTG